MITVQKHQLISSFFLACVVSSAIATTATPVVQTNPVSTEPNKTNLVTSPLSAKTETTPMDMSEPVQPKPPLDNGFLNTYIPYVGIDFAFTNQNYQTGFGKKVFIRYAKEYSGFIGMNITQLLGIELGYVDQTSQIRKPELVAGDSYPGGPVLSTGQFAYLQTSELITSPYIGLSIQKIANVQGLGTTKFQFILAAAAERFKGGEGTLRDQTGAYAIAQYNASYRGFSKTQFVPMLKLAMTVMATDNIGVRVAGTYRGSSRMTIVSEQSSAVQVKMRDTLCFGIGVIYSFGVVQVPADNCL